MKSDTLIWLWNGVHTVWFAGLSSYAVHPACVKSGLSRLVTCGQLEWSQSREHVLQACRVKIGKCSGVSHPFYLPCVFVKGIKLAKSICAWESALQLAEKVFPENINAWLSPSDAKCQNLCRRAQMTLSSLTDFKSNQQTPNWVNFLRFSTYKLLNKLSIWQHCLKSPQCTPRISSRS